MKELGCFLTYINPAVPLTNSFLKAHMKKPSAWQDLVGGKNTIKEIVSAQIPYLFFHQSDSYPPAGPYPQQWPCLV